MTTPPRIGAAAARDDDAAADSAPPPGSPPPPPPGPASRARSVPTHAPCATHGVSSFQRLRVDWAISTPHVYIRAVRLEGKHALVTGSTKGIGLAIARASCAEGAPS